MFAVMKRVCHAATADPLFVDVTGRLLQLCNVRLINSVDFVKQKAAITAHHSAAAAAANSDGLCWRCFNYCID